MASLTSLSPARAADPAPYKPTTGPAVVTSVEADWNDPARNLVVPIKVYFPKDIASAKTPIPVIIFSHGLGGSRETYRLWAEHWASWGYVVILPTHIGSDTSIITGGRAGLLEAINLENTARRVADIKFVLDQVEKADAGTLPGKDFSPLKSKLDLKHLGMAGHSFGAQTTLSLAGETFPAGRLRGSVDPRITAAIAMSPQPASLTDPKVAFGAIRIPVLHLTGTADEMLGITPAQRRIPFDSSAFPDTSLIIFKDATHMTFAPVATRGGAGATLGARLREARGGTATAEEANIHSLIKQSTTAFWDAWLKSDPQAKAWLATDLTKVMGPAGTLEAKNK